MTSTLSRVVLDYELKEAISNLGFLLEFTDTELEDLPPKLLDGVYGKVKTISEPQDYNWPALDGQARRHIFLQRLRRLEENRTVREQRQAVIALKKTRQVFTILTFTYLISTNGSPLAGPL